MDGTFKGGNTVGNLANGGVALAPFHDLDSLVSADLKKELDQVKQDILSGKITMNPGSNSNSLQVNNKKAGNIPAFFVITIVRQLTPIYPPML
jgi:basic membrane lipoprotein Med (substrate-binding protein (PBP1-ABC) superfamily)